MLARSLLLASVFAGAVVATPLPQDAATTDPSTADTSGDAQGSFGDFGSDSGASSLLGGGGDGNSTSNALAADSGSSTGTSTFDPTSFLSSLGVDLAAEQAGTSDDEPSGNTTTSSTSYDPSSFNETAADASFNSPQEVEGGDGAPTAAA
ncbi:hypothetical protein JCM8547_002280 [Rhodosporidiobolus lusitaniae]